MSSTGGRDEYPKFKGWMGEFQLGPEEETIKQRWGALAKVVQAASGEDIETLARLALKWRQAPPTESIERITAHFADDSAFSAAANARELQVLAAIALVGIANAPNHKLAAAAALVVATSLFGGSRKINLPLDLGTLGEASLSALSTGVGRRVPPPGLKSLSRFNFEAAATTISQQNWAQAAVDLKASGATADAALALLAQQFFAVTRAFDQTLKQQDEELQMLWWLLGGKSEDLDVTFDSMSGDVQALVLAKELASHTVLPPGPPSVPALLARAGLKARGKIEVAKAIAGCNQSWLAGLVGGDAVSPLSLPLHCGIQRQLEVGAGNSWVANWAAVTGVKADLGMTPLALGVQFYRERLLLRML